jgi:hypothetical protein
MCPSSKLGGWNVLYQMFALRADAIEAVPPADRHNAGTCCGIRSIHKLDQGVQSRSLSDRMYRNTVVHTSLLSTDRHGTFQRLRDFLVDHEESKT